MTQPVFDFHARLGPGLDAPRRLLESMARWGIARAAVSAGGTVTLDRLSEQIVHGGRSEASADNGRVAQACRDSGGRLVPIHFGNPHGAGIEEYRRTVDDFSGLELSPAVHGLGFTDPAVRALVAVAAGSRQPVYAVCLGRAGTRAADLADLARAFPETTFVFGHCGYFAVDTDGLRRIAPVPNIMAETSGCLSAVVQVALDRLGPDRVLFGTEYPVQKPGVELVKFALLNLDPADWAKVAWHNAHRILEGADHDSSRP